MRTKYIKWNIIIFTLLLLLAASILASLCLGEVRISPFDLFSILKKGDSMQQIILSNIRIPRIILGLSVGGALSLAGVILQGIYRNPLVEPYTMGISGGAALGIAIAIVSGLTTSLGAFILPIFGFIGAIITIFLVYFLSIRKGSFSISRMLLLGVMISFVASSAMMFLMSTTTAENIHSIIFWIMGSLDEANSMLLNIVLYTAILGLIMAYLFARPLNALSLGESSAKHLGINAGLTIKMMFVVSSLLTGICVSVAGVIGFVGLIIPHLMRMIVGSDNRILLISSFLGGSIFVILSDIIARTIIAPNELPIGVITGMIGGVVFIVVLSRSKFKSL